jgi:hypothetical protein
MVVVVVVEVCGFSEQKLCAKAVFYTRIKRIRLGGHGDGVVPIG